MLKNRICIKCRQELKESNFFFRNKKKGLRSSVCKICFMKINSEYKKRNPERIAEIKKREYRKNELRYRSYNLKRKYGISESQYQEMFLKQNGKCAICFNDKTTRKNNKLDVDHCHKTGRVRGLLCSYCNQVIGDAKENKEILLNAIKYLEKEKV